MQFKVHAWFCDPDLDLSNELYGSLPLHAVTAVVIVLFLVTVSAGPLIIGWVHTHTKKKKSCSFLTICFLSYMASPIVLDLVISSSKQPAGYP